MPAVFSLGNGSDQHNHGQSLMPLGSCALHVHFFARLIETHTVDARSGRQPVRCSIAFEIRVLQSGYLGLIHRLLEAVSASPITNHRVYSKLFLHDDQQVIPLLCICLYVCLLISLSSDSRLTEKIDQIKCECESSFVALGAN